MLGLFKRWRAAPALAPERPFYAIGDIHGCYDLLQGLLAQLEPDIPVICLGDYIDRGPNSAEVLRFLHANPQITCLMGNHEAMLLRFLAAPEKNAAWLRHGGVETLESFGLVPQEDLGALCDQLTAAMGAELIAWIQGLPTWWQSGNVVLTHAGADPRGAIADQPQDNLIWGHPDFHRLRRADGLWVVHGHVITSAPTQARGRINIDTGAFATGRLTAARVDPAEVRFIETS